MKKLVDAVKKNSEYAGMMVTNSAAKELVTDNTLLVVLDAHRPGMVACPEILGMANKIVLIDHHRRSTDFIENVSLVYHEPYASSTCEMVTEIMQYIDDSHSMTEFEAMSLYLGILMDTKNFITKTGVRTFEAASFLRRYGLNTSAVKQMFNVDKDDYMHKIDIVKTTQLYTGGTAIAHTAKETPNVRVTASQAADDMLGIAGTKAAFVLYPMAGSVCISARSLGDVNVQIILEQLDGGGHMTSAGACIKNTNISDAEELLRQAIDAYFDEN